MSQRTWNVGIMIAWAERCWRCNRHDTLKLGQSKRLNVVKEDMQEAGPTDAVEKRLVEVNGGSVVAEILKNKDNMVSNLAESFAEQ